jgi:hypothetical protein
MNIKELRENEDISSPTAFVDWMVGGHIHIMPCHFHQGLDNFGWEIAGTDLFLFILYLSKRILYRYVLFIGKIAVSSWVSYKVTSRLPHMDSRQI